jgi:hypothetical protein
MRMLRAMVALVSVTTCTAVPELRSAGVAVAMRVMTVVEESWKFVAAPEVGVTVNPPLPSAVMLPVTVLKLVADVGGQVGVAVAPAEALAPVPVELPQATSKAAATNGRASASAVEKCRERFIGKQSSSHTLAP